jgi:hypothetical protein
MAPWWWSWLLMSVGVTGLWLAGRKSKWGWAIGFGSQVLWLAYSISSRQWGFLASCFAYGTVHFMNFRRWRADSRGVELITVNDERE